MCCSGADHMASGDLNRIESAFAEAALDPGLWSRGLNTANTANFRTTPLALGSGRIPGALISGWVARSARSGSLVAPSDATFGAIARRFARASMPFDMRPPTPPRRENFRKKL
jgi:hypothetical protein